MGDESANTQSCVVDQELSAKIASELQLEQEIRDSEKLPANISDYLDSSSFDVNETTQTLFNIDRWLTCMPHSSTTPPATKK